MFGFGKKAPLDAGSEAAALHGGGVYGRTEADFFNNQEKAALPAERRDQLKSARKWADRHWFISSALELRLAFLNHGLRITSDDADPAWIDDNEERILKYVEDAWREWLIMDNLASFWRDAAATPVVLSAEDCTYSDALGVEQLRVRLNLQSNELQSLPDGLRSRYAKGEVELSTAYGEHFRVLKRAKVGDGFGAPRMLSVFRSLTQSDSMEAADAVLAHAGRTVIRQHRLGHEIKSGPKAGQPVHFWKKDRASAVEKFFKGKIGLVEFTSNFDHDIQYSVPDSKLYDGKKYEGVLNRLLWWAGPCGFLLLASGVTPYLMPSLRTEAQAERRRMKLHLEAVLNAALDAPPGIGRLRLSWSNRCFTETRIANEMVKFLTQQGPLSLRTALEEAGFDPDTERARKADEAETDREELLPLFDANHGDEPGRPDGDTDPVE